MWLEQLPEDKKKLYQWSGIFLLIIAAVAVGVGVYGAFFRVPLIAPLAPADERVEEVVEEELPSVLPRRIDGILVAREDANQVPICVMIENAAFGGVRPQAGLSAASLVYEVIVEGGITRLMAVYAGESAEVVGPIRSARDTYLEFVSEYNCSYVHAGGSFTALLALEEFGLRHIDALYEPQYFYRDVTKFSPHNLFSSTDQLEEGVANHNWTNEEEPDYAMWRFEDEVPAEVITEEGLEVSIAFGGAYDVRFIYNESEGYYERFNGGTRHTDANTGDILTARNVIIHRVGEGIPIEGKGRINWPVTGEGEVIVYRDGQRIVGTWKKEDRSSRTQYVLEDGSEMPLQRGNSWIEIVPESISVE